MIVLGTLIFLAKALINNSYMNEKTCGSTENTRKRQISHILETEPTYATEYNNKKGFAHQNININNTSAVGHIVKNGYELVAHVAWECGCEESTALCMLWRKVQAIM